MSKEFLGYTLVGDIPNKPWTRLQLGYFLFIKDNRYFTCKARAVISGKLQDSDFEPVTDGSFIFDVIDTDPQLPPTLILQKDASQSGHGSLAGHYVNLENRDKVLAAGELYFLEGKLLLNNPKSGEFKLSGEQVCSALSNLLGPNVSRTFFAGVEEDDIAQELARRKTMLSPSKPISSRVTEISPVSDVLPITFLSKRTQSIYAERKKIQLDYIREQLGIT